VSFLTEGLKGQIRHWDVKGPRGVVRFELAEGAGLQKASIYLHARAGDGPSDGPCKVSGVEECWHDALIGGLANITLNAFRISGRESLILADLADYYDNHLPDGGEQR
jgi:hypothetical protein